MQTKAAVASATTILIADADEDNRLLYGDILRSRGFRVIEAADGREALRQARTRRPAVVITETRLPLVDGYDLCTLLRRHARTRDSVIVVVTADAFASQVARATESGADAVLVKPCLPLALYREVQRLLDSSRSGRRTRRTAAVDTRIARSAARLRRPK
jgi:CheY-like chemotaxis protein